MADETPRATPAQTYRESVEAEASDQFFTASEHPDVVALRELVQKLAVEILMRVPPGSQRSLALTDLESVQMRANRGLFSKHPNR